MDESIQLDMLPFYSESLSLKDFLYKDIDLIYSQNKYIYYECAKKSSHYNNRIAQSNTLIVDEYYKKMVGILTHISGDSADPEMWGDIFKLFKKGFKKIYLFFKDKKQMDFNEFMGNTSINKSILDDDSLNANVAAAMFFVTYLQIEAANIDIAHSLLYQRQLFNNNNLPGSFDITKISENVKNEIRKQRKLIPKDFNSYLKTDMKGNCFEFLYDTKDALLSRQSLFREETLTSLNIDEIILSYLSEKKNPNVTLDLEFNDYFLASTHILMLLKAYKRVKKMYFENNKETMFIEFSNMEKELSKTKLLLSTEEAQKEQLLKELSITIEAQSKELTRLKKEKIEAKKHDVELKELRSFIYNSSKEDAYIQEDDTSADIEFLRQYTCLIVGGHGNWHGKLIAMFPNWKFISTDVSNIDNNTIINSDYIFFYTSYLTHSLYYKIMNCVEQNNLRIGYINNVNLDIVIKNIVRDIKEQK